MYGIFKILNSDQNIPLIKYNPGKKLENIYRFYTDKIATNGKKIPYLKKSKIINLMKVLGKNKEVSIFIEEESINLNFFDDGKIEINVDIENENAKTIEEMNILLKSICNPIIEKIQKFLEEKGYPIIKFNGLYDNQIEIIDLEYKFQSKLTKKLNLW